MDNLEDQQQLFTDIKDDVLELDHIIKGLSGITGDPQKLFDNWLAGLKEVSKSLRSKINFPENEDSDGSDPNLRAISPSSQVNVNHSHHASLPTSPAKSPTLTEETKLKATTQGHIVDRTCRITQNLCKEFEELSTSNIFILPVKNVKVLIDQSLSNKNSVSLPFHFYTCYFGYRLKCTLRVDENNVALDVTVGQGEYDKMLAFPFDRCLEVLLVNLVDFSNSIVLKGGLSEFPLTLINTKLLTGDFTFASEYLRNDTFYLQIRALNIDESNVPNEPSQVSILNDCVNLQIDHDNSLRKDFPLLLKSNPAIFVVEDIQEIFENITQPTSFCPYQPIQKSYEFYTGHFGYKIRCNLQITKDIIEIGFQILPGEYDNLLQWPFKKSIRIILLDQLSQSIFSQSENCSDIDPHRVFEFCPRPVEKSKLVEAVYLKMIDKDAATLKLLPLSSLFLDRNILLPSKYIRNDRLYILIKSL